MTCRLEIAHPNEIIDGGWRVVENNVENIEEHLSSPSFDVDEYTVVRAVTPRSKVLFSGIFRNGAWVNVSANSKFFKEKKIKFQNPHPRSCLVALWHGHNDPLNIFRLVPDIHTGRVARNVVKSLFQWMPETEQRPQIAIETYERWLRDPSIQQEKMKSHNDAHLAGCSRNEEDYTENMGVKACAAAAYYATPPERINSLPSAIFHASISLSAFKNISTERANLDIAEMIRREVSFYDVVKALIP